MPPQNKQLDAANNNNNSTVGLQPPCANKNATITFVQAVGKFATRSNLAQTIKELGGEFEGPNGVLAVEDLACGASLIRQISQFANIGGFIFEQQWRHGSRIERLKIAIQPIPQRESVLQVRQTS